MTAKCYLPCLDAAVWVEFGLLLLSCLKGEFILSSAMPAARYIESKENVQGECLFPFIKALFSTDKGVAFK